MNMDKQNVAHIRPPSEKMLAHLAKLHALTRQRHPFGVSTWHAYYLSYERGARERQLEFGVTEEQFIKFLTSNCVYCGATPQQKLTHQRKYGSITHNGIDRVDPSKGYVDGNMVTACWTCNNRKSDMTLSEFCSWTSNIAQKHANNQR
jgi:5-methylcytosine-specific restriction endonuclease McrA